MCVCEREREREAERERKREREKEREIEDRQILYNVYTYIYPNPILLQILLSLHKYLKT